MITLKGVFWDSYSLLTTPWTVSNTYAQVAAAQSCANCVQHIECLTCAAWKWAGHIAQMNDNRWTIRGTERQINFVRSVGRPKHWHCGSTGNSVVKDQSGCCWMVVLSSDGVAAISALKSGTDCRLDLLTCVLFVTKREREREGGGKRERERGGGEREREGGERERERARQTETEIQRQTKG